MSLKKIFKKRKKLKAAVSIKRLDVRTEEVDGLDIGTRKIINLLNYTKRSASAYDGEGYDVGYHSFNIGGRKFKGQRDPTQRFANVEYDFTGKTLLDIGCNQGGMIHEVADQIKHGVGIDYDSRMINVANRIRSYNNSQNVDFFVFNLEEEPLDMITDLLPEGKVDIAFLLSVCMWFNNWKDVVKFVYDHSDALLFESNGKVEQQDEQIAYLNELYSRVDLLAATSEDDPRQKRRKLLICYK